LYDAGSVIGGRYHMKANTRILSAAVIIAAAMLAASCGQKATKNVPFSGVWKQTDENLISAVKTEREMRIICDGKRYRIESDSRDGEYSRHSTEIFDGQNIYAKLDSAYSSPDTAGDAATLENKGFTKIKIDETKAKKIRDEWYNNPVPNFKKGTGGMIAGVETVFYEGIESRPDGEITLQVWVDPKSGLVLKSVFQIYSKQVEQLISRKTRECVSLQAGAIDESAFAP